ncbi:DUF885 domain-containing protein [Massilia sp. RP-1-19]|uniref:DUF885 domain-containing protein n=1 Tax=Massilia polaris TaxID=2728846 RepID=A0A848HJS9_9BURK|nr:DUF885 domain-containing protein [Massilia polaris]NML60389.1 DUF885 domain-containing protein [Massilia polaris]
MRKLLAICVVSMLPLVAAAADTAEQPARSLYSADWQWRLRARPEYATAIGDHRFNNALSDSSLAASRAALLHHRAMLQQARAIVTERLPAQDRLSLELFIHEHDEILKQLAFYPYQLQPISNQDGLHIRFAQMVAQMPFTSESDYRNYLARLDAVPAHVDGLIEQMREGMVTGWVAPKTTIAGVPAMLRAMRESIESGALAAPFAAIPATITPALREELAAAGPAALRIKVAPALQVLEAFIRNEYLPAARDAIAASALPGGAEYYALLVAQQTGGASTPAEVHALGLREVERIRANMRGVIARTGFTGTFAQFSAFANSDKRLFYTKPEKLLVRYRSVMGRANAQLARLFLTLPAEELVVKPAARENGDALGGAYYEEGSAIRAAGLVVNTARLDARPIWEIESLALHEGVPGHHLQVARAHQLAGLPAFRRHAWYPAFGEGWALYAESLGYEMGFYKDAFSAFGQLNSELLRAARMVADTGIHAMGWSRQQAADYLNANTANAPADNEIEVDRYIAQPAKALAYKAGQLRIQALRARAQMVLGERFDVRQFHEALLGNGPLPLPIMERLVGRWIEESLEAASHPAPPRAANGS